MVAIYSNKRLIRFESKLKSEMETLYTFPLKEIVNTNNVYLVYSNTNNIYRTAKPDS